MSREILVKFHYIELHINPFSRSRVVSWVQTDGPILIGAPHGSECVKKDEVTFNRTFVV
jgi:hypothetical protein